MGNGLGPQIRQLRENPKIVLDLYLDQRLDLEFLRQHQALVQE